MVYLDLWPAREVYGQGARTFLHSFPEQTEEAREFVRKKRAEGCQLIVETPDGMPVKI